jgi:hypothetical protein
MSVSSYPSARDKKAIGSLRPWPWTPDRYSPNPGRIACVDSVLQQRAGLGHDQIGLQVLAVGG